MGDEQMIATVIGMTFTIIALTLALIQLRDARIQTSNLVRIRESLSTRYIAQFPEYVPAIVELFEQARTEILIVCDVPTYGFLSDRTTWLKYRQALETKIENDVIVKIECLSESRMTDLVNEQFNLSAEDFTEWKNVDTNREKLEAFLRYDYPSWTLSELALDDFLGLVASYAARTTEASFAGALVQELNFNMPLYFWIVDRTQAIFAIPTFAQRDFGFTYGFYTSDTRLVGALLALAELYEQWSSKATIGAQNDS